MDSGAKDADQLRYIEQLPEPATAHIRGLHVTISSRVMAIVWHYSLCNQTQQMKVFNEDRHGKYSYYTTGLLSSRHLCWAGFIVMLMRMHLCVDCEQIVAKLFYGSSYVCR